MKKAIQEAKKMIEEEILDRKQTASSGNGNSEYYSYCDGRKSSLEQLIERLEKIPQELTTDELLEEMKMYFPRIYPLENGKWFARTENMEICRTGKTPREALLALKEKLPTNQ